MKTTTKALSSYLLLSLTFGSTFSIPLFMNNSSASAATTEKSLNVQKPKTILAKKTVKCARGSKKLSCKK